MQRQRWFEIHDQAWFPGFLRDRVTEALEAVWDANHTYRPIAARLRDAVRQAGADRIVDLCSGGGGPWRELYDDVAASEPLEVCLTDLYPNAGLTGSAKRRGVSARMEPVDAQQVPRELRGFRTIFSAFHHFDPKQARAMLADAFLRREGIGVFEAARRDARTMLGVCAVPLLAMRAAARARPVRWGRILWTWILPVVPALLLVDGVLSCLRSYSEADMQELTAGLDDPEYSWEIGEQHGGSVAIRYLIGTPVRVVEAHPGEAEGTMAKNVS